ncbi:hypothetical protein [Streptomyces sp. NPDC007088]
MLWSAPGGAERVPTLTAVAEAWFGTPA